ncbi:protein tyrosine phosphatase [Rhodococcus sp. NPDC058521]|uniref:arsenate reductase/protein-tyrosine-phosphatase family protein n=1 Tax=Rhodococcus sp. NPDC058521 TaxID=3346536 RepID=UPI0036607E6F
MHVLFVCTENVSRSATAERITTAFAEEVGTTELVASSAGTKAKAGQPMEKTAAAVLEGLGGDPSGFSARGLTAEIAGEADLVLTMTESDRDEVVKLAPKQSKKTFTLKEAARLAEASGATTVSALDAARSKFTTSDGPEDVADPSGKDEDTYLSVGSEIAELTGALTRSVRS